MTGAEAAELLGVKRETLYAYASRGVLRGVPGGRGRARLYLRADIERLKARHDARAGHGPVAAEALRWGEPVLESALTAIGPRGPVYRGKEAVALALEDVPFEAVAELLWTGELPAGGAPAARPGRPSVRPAKLAALLPEGTPPLAALALVVPALGAHDPARHVGAPSGDGRIPTSDAERARARALVRSLAALVGLGRDPARATAALEAEGAARRLLVALGASPSKKAERAVNRALSISADHELNASTFAVRVAASTGADLYACVSAGLAALSGPRHGGATDRVEALVAEAARPERAAAAVHERLRRGEPIPGFGHRLYPEGDPRAQALLDTARALAPQSAALRTVLALVDALRDAGHDPPSLDMGLVAITAALGLPSGAAAALFAVGRAAGWIAHAFEQREAGYMLRPRARYTGP
ncbi:citrate synthase [Sorangium cellulosum So0157-2]|uniref:citrate synthase (unknown stereospecificity) n=1 Tax=Sorangium cellulosum So0157-2 TaxID=1254432 RepID=S4XR44_SORCE|nr:citrate synthase [Sorangium cellulosum So0157-2]